MVDSTDVDRLSTSREEFHSILDEEELKEAVVVVFANKQDLPGALTDAQASKKDGLCIHSRFSLLYRVKTLISNPVYAMPFPPLVPFFRLRTRWVCPTSRTGTGPSSRRAPSRGRGSRRGSTG